MDVEVSIDVDVLPPDVDVLPPDVDDPPVVDEPVDDVEEPPTLDVTPGSVPAAVLVEEPLSSPQPTAMATRAPSATRARRVFLMSSSFVRTLPNDRGSTVPSVGGTYPAPVAPNHTARGRDVSRHGPRG
jgi:hypothetical protein